MLCFSWNTEQIPLCEGYLNNKTTDLITKSRGTFSYTTPCYNPLFFDEIENEIIKYLPRIKILVFFTEGDLESGTWFHSDFLPNKFAKGLKYPLQPGQTGEGPQLRFGLLSRDKFSGQSYNNKKTVMRMSIYIAFNDNDTKVVELNKGYVFNDNTLDCNINYQSQNYVESAKILALYTQSSLGTIAFIGVQYRENTLNEGRMCIKQLEEKFINNKNIDYVFIMGDFANDIKAGLSSFDPATGNPYPTMINPVTKNYYRPFNIEGKITELLKFERDSIPEHYQSGKTNKNDVNPNDLQDIGFTFTQSKRIETEEGRSRLNSKALLDIKIGYHDRILYRTLNNNKQQIICTEYKIIKNLPRGNDIYHYGILGIYQI